MTVTNAQSRPVCYGGHIQAFERPRSLQRGSVPENRAGHRPATEPRKQPLLDTVPNLNLVAAIRERLKCGDHPVSDLHLWRLGPGHSGLIATIISHRPQPPAFYKEQLAGIDGLSHITVEVHHCR